MNAIQTQILCAGIGICTMGTGSLFTGCAGLDYSAQGEGTGVQILGGVIVLAKYHASAKQKAIAEQQARAVVARAAKPAHDKRRAGVHADSAKKIEATRRDYDTRISALSKTQPAAHGSVAADEVRRLQQEKEQTLARLQADADRSMNDEEASQASAREHLPHYIAVPVPPQEIAAEQGAKATIMVWDTRLQRLASENVLVLDRQISNGVDVKADGITARYVKN